MATVDKTQDSETRSEVIKLVECAMRGDMPVWNEIYKKTDRYVYFLIVKFVHSEQDVEDLIQNIYTQAIQAIGQLKSSESFYGWLRSIILSNCNNWIKKREKKKDILIEEDENGESMLNDVPEISDHFIPDMALDNEESRNMILALIDALPYLQRQTVMLYFYEELTVEEIASTMNCPVGTVKSRLNYARQQIKSGVEEHEKKGIKLYGAVGMPVLSIILKQQEKAFPIPSSISSGFDLIAKQLSDIQPSSTSPHVNEKPPTNNVNSHTQEYVKSTINNVENINRLGNAASMMTIAAIPLLAKVTAGVLIAGLIGSGVFFLVNGTDSRESSLPTTTESSITESATQEEHLGEEGDGTRILEVVDTSYFDQMDNSIKVLLVAMADAMKRQDYYTAYTLQKDDRFMALFETLSFTGGFGFRLDDGTMVRVETGEDGENCIYLLSDGGENSDGYLSILNDTGRVYILGKANYSHGISNGGFVGTVIDYFYDDIKIYEQRGDLYGPVFEDREGSVTQIPAPAWISKWPIWIIS